MNFHLLYQKRFNNIQTNLKLGSKNKLKRFKENETFSNVFQPTREVLVDDLFPLKGKTQFYQLQHNWVLVIVLPKRLMNCQRTTSKSSLWKQVFPMNEHVFPLSSLNWTMSFYVQISTLYNFQPYAKSKSCILSPKQ